MASASPPNCDSLLAFGEHHNKHRKMRIFLRLLLALLAAIPAMANAQITVHFYSHEFGSSFPHGFVTVEGKTSDGTVIDANYGFTAKTVSPAILWGSVSGKVEVLKPGYIQSSDRQFSVTISDKEHAEMLIIVDRWRTAKQPSYSLNKANCLHFVGQIAASLGLSVDYPKELMRKPKSYLRYIAGKNAHRVEQNDMIKKQNKLSNFTTPHPHFGFLQKSPMMR